MTLFPGDDALDGATSPEPSAESAAEPAVEPSSGPRNFGDVIAEADKVAKEELSALGTGRLWQKLRTRRGSAAGEVGPQLSVGGVLHLRDTGLQLAGLLLHMVRLPLHQSLLLFEVPTLPPEKPEVGAGQRRQGDGGDSQDSGPPDQFPITRRFFLALASLACEVALVALGWHAV